MSIEIFNSIETWAPTLTLTYKDTNYSISKYLRANGCKLNLILVEPQI